MLVYGERTVALVDLIPGAAEPLVVAQPIDSASKIVQIPIGLFLTSYLTGVKPDADQVF